MTEPDWSGGATAAKPALSKRAIRTWAWTAGAISFLSPWALLGLSPKPASATPVAPAPPQQPKVIIHVIRRVIYTAAPASTSSSGGIQYVYAPSTSYAAPVAASCGSHPC